MGRSGPDRLLLRRRAGR